VRTQRAVAGAPRGDTREAVGDAAQSPNVPTSTWAPIDQREDTQTMNFHSNTSRYDFIVWLRDVAIEGGMSTPFIDCIDALDDAADLEAELEKQGEELTQAEKDRDDLRQELSDLLEAIETVDPDEEPAAWSNALKAAKNALERHT